MVVVVAFGVWVAWKETDKLKYLLFCEYQCSETHSSAVGRIHREAWSCWTQFYDIYVKVDSFPAGLGEAL